MRLFVLAALSLSLCAQQQQTATEKPGRVSGKVLNAITGEPVRKATVTMQPAGAQQMQGGPPGFGVGMRGGSSAATDNAGNFVFESVTPGRYRVSGEKTGFIRSTFGGRGGGIGSEVIVSAGSDKADVVVRMTPQGIVSGRILDEDGEPMEGVSVSLIRPTYFQAQRRMMGQGANQTNDRGDFRITNVAPGKYYVLVQRINMGNAPIQQGKEEFGYPKLYFPGVETLEQAQRVDVGAGQEFSGVQMTLRKVRVYRVKGRVAGVEAPSPDAAGGNRNRRGGGGMVVQLRADGSSGDMGFGFGPPGMGGGQVRPDGTFELASITPGAYKLTVSSFDGGRPKVVGSMKLSVGNNNVDGIVVSPSPVVSFQGKVTVEGDKTLVNLKQVRIQVQGEMPFNQPLEVAEDGSFTLKDLSPEKYKVSLAQQLPNAYVKAINVGGQDIRETGIDLSGGGGGPMEVILSTKIAKVDGMVEKQKQDDAPGTVIVAKVGPNSELTFINLTARVEDAGKFSIANLPPGEYKIFAFEEVDMATASDPEFLKKFEDRAGSVKIGEGESKSLSLKQIRYAETTSAPA
jgi:protocatechuate 3,4-dioxygenase beta subunit